ncbi:MAG TPA: hypothetical protein VE736_02035 [Gaiellaceae bacterium]|nr:hypothetical protein [Gaiellaceae bacterium]
MLWSRSKRWRWAERVDLWDSHCEEIAIRAQEEAVRKMNAEHATIAFEGLRLVMQRLVGDDAAGVTAIDPNRLSARDIAALAPVLAKMERLARGAETERVENAGRPIEIKFAFDPTPKIIGDVPGPSDPRDFPAESSN